MTARSDHFWSPKKPDLSLEQAFWQLGIVSIGGIDEAGRGAWAGPVSAGVVLLPTTQNLLVTLDGVRDSKQMTPHQRAFWGEQIKSMATSWAVGMASHQEIDEVGILQATRLAARRAVESLAYLPEALLLDWLHLPEVALPQIAIIKGDNRSLSIACASVLAKTSRDAVLIQMDELYPVYGFAAHKGYGTSTHLAALQNYGPCPIHRLSFKPLRALSIDHLL
jgi:ribonuclease HII